MVNPMTTEQYQHLMAHPQDAGAEHLAPLEELIRDYPYLASARMLRLAILVRLNDVRAEAELPRTVIYAPSPRSLHEYIYAGKHQPHTEPEKRHTQPAVPAGSYFDTLQRLEQQAAESHKTLAELARELARARQLKTQQERQAEQKAAQQQAADPEGDKYAAEYREALKNKDIDGALEILSKINLHNPKKISYFAEQKRYLELVREIARKK